MPEAIVMQQEPAYQWSQRGQLFLWKYTLNTRNYPGSHLTWDIDGQRSLIDLLELLENSSVGTSRTLKLHAPSETALSVPNNKVQKVISWEKLSITLVDSANSHLSETQNSLSMEANSEKLSELRDAIHQVEESRDESTLGFAVNRLTLWWSL